MDVEWCCGVTTGIVESPNYNEPDSRRSSHSSGPRVKCLNQRFAMKTLHRQKPKVKEMMTTGSNALPASMA